MSSNSSAEPARRLLVAAFDVLGSEAPVHHGLLHAALGALAVTLLVGDEVLAPRVRGDRIVVERAEASRVTVRTDLDAACALLEARLTLAEAIARGVFDVRGTADSLDAAAGALDLFLHGLVRCPSGAALLDDLRREVSNPR